MPEGGQPSERPSKDLARIVYHAQSRTFARLFKEQSLDEVKDVVRRKLGLGQEIDVSLKQMGPDALLDLDDDDDFQAFRILVSSSVSVDIQVTVGKSVPPPVTPRPRRQQQPKVAAQITPSSPSMESTAQAITRPSTTSAVEPSTATKKTPEPSVRKRKVSFSDTPAVAPDKPSERRGQPKSGAATLVSSTERPETPAAANSTDAGEPPKKKQKKEVVKTKEVQPTEGGESHPTKASGTTKPRVRKSTASDRVTEVGTGVSEDGGPSEPPAKKPKKQKKDDTTVSKKVSAGPAPDGVDEPVSQPNPTDDPAPQPQRRVRSSAKSGVSKTRQSEQKIGVCAAIPRTSASANVQSEVAAAILSGYFTKEGSETAPPPPPAKRKSVKKVTKKPTTSSNESLSKSMVVDAPSNATPSLSTKRGPVPAFTANELSSQTQDHGPLCPICLGGPFHIRYRCPTVLKGPDAIRERLEEVKKSNADEQHPLIKELEGLLRDTEVASQPSSSVAPPHEVQSQEASEPLDVPVSRTPNIPSNSNLSEVTVESRDEGSSSESSDDVSEGGKGHNKALPAPGKQKIPSLPSDDLEAVIRGPVLKRQSILSVLDRIVEGEKDKGSDSEEEEVEPEEDPEEMVDRSSSRRSKHTVSSSDSETEEEESRSPSPLLSTKDNPRSSVQGSDSAIERSTEHPDNDVVMQDSIDPPILRGHDDDSSEETHVGSEDRVVVKDAAGEKGVTPIIEEQLTSPTRTSVPKPLDASSNEPQESGETEVDPTANEGGGVQEASKLPGVAEADPIEPADDLEPAVTSHTSNSDPIEALPEDIGTLLAGAAKSTPKPGIAKRIKTRDGQILGDEDERPILLEHLAASVAEEANLSTTKGKPRSKVVEVPASQERTSTRRSTRSSSHLPSTSTPVPEVLLTHRVSGTRSVKSAKMPAKRSEQRMDGSQSSTNANKGQVAARLGPTASLARWETLAEPSSPPSLLPDEPSMHTDQLMSSSPPPEDNGVIGRSNTKGKKSTPHTPALPSGVKNSRLKERLFDLSSSQVPFPYSQHKVKPPSGFPNGKEKGVATDSDLEEEAKTTKKKAKTVAYRPLSQLASEAALFSLSLPTPTHKPVKTKKRAASLEASKDSPSSSSSSDEDEANKSAHIPQGRRAGTVLETRRKKSLLSRI